MAALATQFLVAHLQPVVDQACAALVCYKLHRLTITLPVLSLDFWRYLPSCMLSDFIAIVVLQFITRWTVANARRGAAGASSAQARRISNSSSSNASSDGHRSSASSAFSMSDDDPSTASEAGLLLYHSQATGEKGESWKDGQDSTEHAPSWKIWAAFSFLLFFISFSQIIFAVLAIGAFQAGDIVVSWKDALTFEAEGRTDFLVASAIQSWYFFAGAYLAIFLLARLGRWLSTRQWQDVLRKVSKKQNSNKDNKLYAWTPRLLLASYVLLAICFRPPRMLPSSDLLWEGLHTSAILFATKIGLVHPHAYIFQMNDTLYGKSNILEPRITPLDEIRHVFIVSLESADGLAWPYTPKYCEQRNCMDIPDEYNTAQHITPFFQSLIEKENTFFTSDYKANIAYTAKSHFGLACGQLPEYKNWVKAEIEMDPPLPCLPDVLRAADPAFKSAHWTSQAHDWDHYGIFVLKAGYDKLFGRAEMEADYLRQGIKWPALTNFFGYSEQQAMPYLMDWVDERIAANERVFVTMPGNVMHHHFGIPPEDEMQNIEYTKHSSDVSKYLNSVRWTDNYLRVFFGELEKRGLLDNSMVILAGDHGPRIDQQGAYHTTTGWQDSGIFQVPLLIHAPGLRAIKQPRQHFLNSDLMPTILDAIGVKPESIAKYTGHSILRNRGPEYDRVTFHSQNPGGNARQVTRKQADYNFKALYFDETEDTCATDLYLDPNEELFYCVNEGWRKVNIANKLEDGLTMGLWKAGSPQEIALIEWAKEAADLLQQHFATNAQQWNTSKALDHAGAHEEYLISLKALQNED